MFACFRTSAIALVSLLAVCLLHAGCGGKSDRPRLYPVKGRLLVQGQPAAGARLALTPTENADPALWKMGYPTAIVQADGSFAFSSYEEGDGAPAGNYKLIASWIEGDTGIPDEDESTSPQKQLLDVKYTHPDTTPWSIVVEPKTNQLDTLEVP
jgi:hypothetical protein